MRVLFINQVYWPDVAATAQHADDLARHLVRHGHEVYVIAGVWALHAQERWNILEPGDVEEAMNAAAAVGDDRLQTGSQGYAVPDSFTHGSSAQRVRWFRKGFESGDLNLGDTFSAGDL